MNEMEAIHAASIARRESGFTCLSVVARDDQPSGRGPATRPIRASWLLGLVIFLGTMAPGCSEDKPDFDIITLDQARIEKIDLTSDGRGKITVSYYSEKRKEEVVGEGLVTEETEILINGAVAKLKDLREGERVRGEVRVEKKGREKNQIAIKIFVDRPKPVGGDGG